jgi:uncharacterized protein
MSEVILSRVKFAALCLTHNCNLRCRYCYAGEKVNRSMNRETARRAIDFLGDQSGDSCVVTFFGGEPLMEFDLIKEIVAYSRGKFGGRIEFRMSTNGTLLKPEILEFLKENEIYFVISLDGNQKQHDCSRCFADGRGSYQMIADKLENIFAVNPYTIAVSVVVPETVDYVAAGAKDLFGKGFRYVLQTLDYSARWEHQHLNKLERQYRELAAFYYRSLAAGKKIFYSPFDERIKTRAQKPYGKGDLCDLGNTQIAIAPSGKIYPCVQFIGTDDKSFRTNSIGEVTSGFDEGCRRFFVEQNYLDKESCRGCALYGRCATYCGCVNWRASGALNRIPPIICEHERMLMPIVDKMANKLWKNNVDLFKRKFYEKSFPISSYMEDCLMDGRI